MKIVLKPWGKEEWLELNDKYCYKRIYINAGYKTSFQYHQFKRETNYLISGDAEIWLENTDGIIEKKNLHAGEYFNVIPPQKHRVIALTDIILQEVSTPEVDDVIRIEDDTDRKNGRIENEHKIPAVLILAAGLGNRMKALTFHKNKAMVSIKNKAIISYIIEKFPKEYEIVIAVGYKKESLREYCQIAHSDRKLIFVEVNDWEDGNIGPGRTAIQCEKFLQRPFYITTSDCIINSELPFLDGNWLGTFPTSYPEKYSTIKLDKEKNVVEFSNKSENGHENAFIGLAGVSDYKIFWNELKNNTKNNSELVSAWINPISYLRLKSKELEWFDTGNSDDFKSATEHFGESMSLYKSTEEIIYKINNKVLKFNPEVQITDNKYIRGLKLGNKVPNGLAKTNNFLYYNWEEGQTLYEYNSFDIYIKFLKWFADIIKNSSFYIEKDLIGQFYINKTNTRKNLFLKKYGESYLANEFIINDKKCMSVKSLLEKINADLLSNENFYSDFHGDLQFDNIIYSKNGDKFTYIDWRDSFANSVKGGDLYYDLAKLYGGCLLPYLLIKNENLINIFEGNTIINYNYTIPSALLKFKKEYESWIINNDFDLNKVKLITGIIYLNMSPLHSDRVNKLLWFKSAEILHEYFN